MNLLKTMLVICLAALLSMATGCSIVNKSETPSQPAPAAAAGGASQSNVVSSDARVKASTGRYYDFDDIQVPTQLKLDKEKSILFKVGTFKAGLLTFSDNLEVESLINWFVETMAKDNWTLKSSFKYPKVALFFAKQGKTCVIHITEHTFSTVVEIWVAPAI